MTTKARKRHPTQPTEPKYDPSFLVPTVHSDLWTYPTQGLCPCGTMAPVYDGILGLHMPATEWSDGHRRPVISDAYGSAGCRYGLRTVTLEAALQRDNMLGPVEQHVLRYDRDLFEQGWVFTAPQGYSLPTPIANLFALAEANGWATVQEWVPTVDDGGYVLNLRVGRSEDWRYDLCLFATPDVVYETCCGKSNTPDNPHLHETPPIKKIRAVIRKNPLPEGADHPFVGSPHLWYIDNSHSSWWLP